MPNCVFALINKKPFCSYSSIDYQSPRPTGAICRLTTHTLSFRVIHRGEARLRGDVVSTNVDLESTGLDILFRDFLVDLDISKTHSAAEGMTVVARGQMPDDDAVTQNRFMVVENRLRILQQKLPLKRVNLSFQPL